MSSRRFNPDAKPDYSSLDPYTPMVCVKSHYLEVMGHQVWIKEGVKTVARDSAVQRFPIYWRPTRP